MTEGGSGMLFVVVLPLVVLLVPGVVVSVLVEIPDVVGVVEVLDTPVVEHSYFLQLIITHLYFSTNIV